MNSFNDTLNQMTKLGMKLPGEKIHIRVPDARRALADALTHFLALQNRQMTWLPEYEKVAQWLTHNEGKGLFLYGNCGRGKSLLCRYALPAILLQYCNKVTSVFDIQDMNKDIDRVMSKHIIALDDIGTEEIAYQYGNKRLAFAEIMDIVEKRDKLVIVSTNLQADEIKARYGDRTLDRIKATTMRVLFKGESMRTVNS